MIKFLEIVGYVMVGMIPASIIIYILSRVQARGWMDAFEFYHKSKLNNHEQTKEKK